MPNGADAMTPAQRIENVIGHALVGCGQAVASGGKCGPSALAGGVTSAAGPGINGYGVIGLPAALGAGPNGNQTTGLGRGFAYFSFNKPAEISQGSTYQYFLYDTEHARWVKATPEGGTLYFDAFGVHAELLLSSTSTWYDYISAGGAMVAMRVSGATVAMRYFHTDILGSIAVITDETGAVVERDGYDAWGKRRFATGADDTTNSLTSQTPRGFTGQEELSDVGLVHLNGRIYDPLLARMTSADPMVPDPMNGQAWNRYSYVVNNPLAFTDPSGYCFLGLCGSVGNLFSSFFKDFQHLLRDVPIVGTIVEVAAAAICLGAVVCAVTAAFLSTTAVSGLETGSFKLGLRAGLIAAATAVAPSGRSET
jgi:RHS repeat-associated protein